MISRRKLIEGLMECSMVGIGKRTPKGSKDEMLYEDYIKLDTVLELIESQPPANQCVPLSEIYRVIAGHSDYHGDNILAALTCIAEGKEVEPVRPLPPADFPDTNVGEITLKQAIEAVKALKGYCRQTSVDTCLNGHCPIGAWCFNDRKSEPTPATWKIPQERTEE